MNTHLQPTGLQPNDSSDNSQVPLERIESISPRTTFFQSSASGDAYASAIEVGVSYIRYTIKSSPKDFVILCLLFLTETLLSSFSRTLSGYSNDSTGDSIDVVKSEAISEENLALLCISFIEKMFLKNLASRD